MPRRSPRSEKREANAARAAIDPNVIYEAHEPHCVTLPGADGPIVIKQGDRLRGDHPAVRYNPALFARDGFDEAELVEARHRAFPDEGLT